MAEARSAVAEPRIERVDDFETKASRDFVSSWRKTIFRRIYRTRNLVRNGMWPTSAWNLGVTCSAFSAMLVGDWKWAQPVNRRLLYLGEVCYIHQGVPYPLRVGLISLAGGVTFFVGLLYARRWLLRGLLYYRGWMYEDPKKQSILTKVWGLIVRIVSGRHPTLYSCQRSLPYLPVPSLKDTLDRFIQSIEPLYESDSKELDSYKKRAKEFKDGIGPKLQRILVLKSWWAQNWVTDWWEKYIYLMGRTPISINSNYYALDHGHWQSTTEQVSRAATAIYHFMKVKKMIERETWEPLLIRNTIPVCMAQYDRVFGTTRVPGVEIDDLHTNSDSKHITVHRRGVYYRLSVYDTNGNLTHPQNLEQQLAWIIADADKHADSYQPGERSIAAMTAAERTHWAKTRATHFSTGANSESLDVIETALFHVVLDTAAYDSWVERGKHLLHGIGDTTWFDKSFSLIFFSNGRMGMNCEHSWADAPVMGHVCEYFLSEEVRGGLYQDDGTCIPIHKPVQSGLIPPQRLYWEMSEPLQDIILTQLALNQKNNDDLHLAISDHYHFGKGLIKKCKVSPDAFIQMALHLAYYKMHGELVLTYEASMTRLYVLGRTETVRSLTSRVKQFVKAMMDPDFTNAERIELCRRCSERHSLMYKDAMNGKGLDRHMFGLFVVAKGLGYECDFLRNALMMPWTLSTSQQPQQQIATNPSCSDPKYADMLCPGGGFGPVSDEGYGVSYMIPGEDRLFFHVSSKRSSNKTNSDVFMENIFAALSDMKSIFQNPDGMGDICKRVSPDRESSKESSTEKNN